MITTNEIESALCMGDVNITSIERGENSDPDIIRLSGDKYLVIDFEEAERVGVVFVFLNESMHSGLDPTLADWTLPPTTPAEIVTSLSSQSDRFW